MSASGDPLHPARLDDRKLDSWKEIADYLDREVRTVQRWEKTENLPVRRHEHQKKSTVYAFTSELDEWRKNRQPKDDPEADAAFVPEPDAADEGLLPNRENHQGAPPATKENEHRTLRIGRWLGVAVLGASLVALLSVTYLNLSLDPPHLGVIAAASSSAYAGKPITEIGHALDVQYALTGSVRREGNRVRIDAQLVQVSDQTQLWTDRYDRNLNDILGVQEEVAAAVAGKISLALNPSPTKAGGAVAKRTVNPEAYDAYLRGRCYWTNRGDLHKSLESYQQAIQIDSQYALAYAGLANGYALLGQVPYDDLKPSDAKPKAKQAAEHALQLDPEL